MASPVDPRTNPGLVVHCMAGMLAAVLEEWPAAEAHFERALLLNRQMGANTWAAHTAYQYARMLRARGRAQDDSRAAELLASASQACDSFGLEGLRAKLDALIGSAPPS